MGQNNSTVTCTPISNIVTPSSTTAPVLTVYVLYKSNQVPKQLYTKKKSCIHFQKYLKCPWIAIPVANVEYVIVGLCHTSPIMHTGTFPFLIS